MCSTIAHAASASLVALTFAGIAPSETPYVAAALVSASILDLDHLFYVIRDRDLYRRVGYRGQLHLARSVFHELLGLLLAGVVSALLFTVDPALARVVFVAFAVHIAQDWVIGKSHPLAPADGTATQFFAPTFNRKVGVDVVIVAISGVLWVPYLAGAL